MTKPEHLTTQLEVFLVLLKHLQSIDPEFPLQYAICFGEIAMNEGISVSELAHRGKISLSTVSRIVGALSDYRKNGQPYELVSLQICPQERRRKELYLTDKGRELLADISLILEPEKLRRRA